MRIGTVRCFDVLKGYGFIQPDDGGVDVLVDICAVERAGMACLDQGQRLSFELVRDERIARTRAENLAPVRALHVPYVRHRWAAEPWGPLHAAAAITSSRLPSAPTRTIGGIWSGKTAGRGGRLPA